MFFKSSVEKMRNEHKAASDESTRIFNAVLKIQGQISELQTQIETAQRAMAESYLDERENDGRKNSKIESMRAAIDDRAGALHILTTRHAAACRNEAAAKVNLLRAEIEAENNEKLLNEGVVKAAEEKLTAANQVLQETSGKIIALEASMARASSDHDLKVGLIMGSLKEIEAAAASPFICINRNALGAELKRLNTPWMGKRKAAGRPLLVRCRKAVCFYNKVTGELIEMHACLVEPANAPQGFARQIEGTLSPYVHNLENYRLNLVLSIFGKPDTTKPIRETIKFDPPAPAESDGTYEVDYHGHNRERLGVASSIVESMPE